MRIEYPGAVYHVTSRGNERKEIFINDEDRKCFLDLLKKVKERFHWLFHGYVLMGNHYHLLIETPEANLSRGMKHLNGLFCQEFNRRHNRVGHLFQGRFKAILIDKDEYLLTICRYIVLNPVRAGITEKIDEWPWSNYRAFIGLEKMPVWLSVDWILSQFGSNRKKAACAFQKFIQEDIGGSFPVESFHRGVILGGRAFIERIAELIESKKIEKEIPKRQRYAMKLPLHDVFQGRTGNKKELDALISRAYVDYGYNQKEIADYLGVHYSGVSRAIQRHEKSRKT